MNNPLLTGSQQNQIKGIKNTFMLIKIQICTELLLASQYVSNIYQPTETI